MESGIALAIHKPAIGITTLEALAAPDIDTDPTIPVAAAMTLALLLLVPRGHSVITVWGTRTLYVYLLHGLIVQLLRGTGVVDWFGEFGSAGVLMLIGLGIAVTLVLSMSWVTKVFWPVIEPKLPVLFEKDPAAIASK